MKILIVEDDPIVGQALKFLLTSKAYAVDLAIDGGTALQMVRTFEYSLIVLDLILPDLDGISLCQTFRREGYWMPILVLTGQGGTQLKTTALHAGADDYVVKPFDTEEFLARVQALLRRGDAIASTQLTWGKLCVTPHSRTVTYGTEMISLTAKEYAILEILLRSPSIIYSTSMLIDQVWESTASRDQTVVRFHVKELRRKLTDAGVPKDFIKTVHGVGYRLNLLYASAPSVQTNQPPPEPQIAELKTVNQGLRTALEQLRSSQTTLHQKNQELQAARDDLEQQLAKCRAELHQQGQLLNSLYDGLNQAIFIIDIAPGGEFRYFSCNRAAEQYIGQTNQAIQGKTPEQALGSVIGKTFQQSYERCLQIGTSLTSEQPLVFDDRIIWILTTLSPLRDHRGDIYRIVANATDITNQKQLGS